MNADRTETFFSEVFTTTSIANVQQVLQDAIAALDDLDPADVAKLGVDICIDVENQEQEQQHDPAL